MPKKRKKKAHTGFTCKICHKWFRRPCYEEIHMRTHTGEKPFSCDECGRCFAREEGRQLHMKIHSSMHLFSYREMLGFLWGGVFSLNKTFLNFSFLFSYGTRRCSIVECVLMDCEMVHIKDPLLLIRKNIP